VPLPVTPTLVPAKFIVCVGFNPTATKGVFVHRDKEADGNSLVGLPGGKAEPFAKGDWMIRVQIDQAKPGRRPPR
jgi:RNA polymerase sigma-70 factor (ECF subfamily)